MSTSRRCRRAESSCNDNLSITRFFQNLGGNTLADQDSIAKSNPLADEQTTDQVAAELTGKRKFVEPEISQPVDVLEATTFFQALDSGSTN